MDILQQAENDVPVPDLCREHSMSSASLYKWHAKFGGMNTLMIKRMKELAEENRRVKSMVAEERLKSELRKDALEGELQSHLFAVRWLIKRWRMPKAAFATTSESCYRYQARRSIENATMTDLVVRLTHYKRNWSFDLYSMRSMITIEKA